jgi:hypothetical protein
MYRDPLIRSLYMSIANSRELAVCAVIRSSPIITLGNTTCNVVIAARQLGTRKCQLKIEPKRILAGELNPMRARQKI